MIHPIENWRTYDDNGVMMPWYTRPCLEWLDKLDLSRKLIFEYGCGASSLWYQSRGATICGVDSNEDWIFITYTDRDDSYQLVKEDSAGYTKGAIKYISEVWGEFDLIIIDGIYRDDCTEHALKHLKKGGYLIADNFEQPSVEPFWPKTRELTKNLPLTIYKEPTHPDWQTAVWHNV